MTIDYWLIIIKWYTVCDDVVVPNSWANPMWTPLELHWLRLLFIAFLSYHNISHLLHYTDRPTEPICIYKYKRHSRVIWILHRIVFQNNFAKNNYLCIWHDVLSLSTNRWANPVTGAALVAFIIHSLLVSHPSLYYISTFITSHMFIVQEWIW